jgi:mono/diheme cytochrome c family protein
MIQKISYILAFIFFIFQFNSCMNNPVEEVKPEPPPLPPSITVPIDEALYRQNGCEACHGSNGSGQVEKPLKSKPADFRIRSSYKQGANQEQIKKAIQRGVAGTEMKGYSHLTLYEVTSIAKYIKKMQQE